MNTYRNTVTQQPSKITKGTIPYIDRKAYVCYDWAPTLANTVKER